jgi:crotonobetainyl-CoA:carnitine CoA-transferase CaiB-like acyl-CoA transferase
MRAKPLAGIRILDLTRLLPGSMCTLHLADMGADVVKIEDPDQGDYSRWIKPVKKKHSSFFLTVNRNKRSIKLNLRKPEGKAVFFDLLKNADAVVESFRPGVADRLSVGYADVAKANPRIVYCSISGYGQDGPYRERAGHDLNYCAYAGVVDQCGDYGGPPALINFQIADLAGGSLAAAMGMLGALVEQQRTGLGRYVDVSMTDCTLAHAVIALARLDEQGATRARGDDYLTGGIPSYGVYATADGRYMSLGALEPKFWDAFCDAVERPEWKGKGETWGEPGRRIRAELALLFKSKPWAYWTALGERVDCCLAPVLTLAESMANAQLNARGMFVVDDHPSDGPVHQFAHPIKYSDDRFAIARSAPLHGQHTDEVLTDLGYDAAKIAALRAAAVI